MHAGIVTPRRECLQRALLMVDQVGTNAEFRGKALRQLVLRAHRQFEMLETVRGDVEHMWQIEKGRHAVAGIPFEFRPQ